MLKSYPSNKLFNWLCHYIPTVAIIGFEMLWQSLAQGGTQFTEFRSSPTKIAVELGDESKKIPFTLNIGGIGAVEIISSHALDIVKPLTKEVSELSSSVPRFARLSEQMSGISGGTAGQIANDEGNKANEYCPPLHIFAFGVLGGLTGSYVTSILTRKIEKRKLENTIPNRRQHLSIGAGRL